MEKDTKVLLKDEELDAVVGGFGFENREICEAVRENKALFKDLTEAERKAVESYSLDEVNKILVAKLGINVEFETKGMTTATNSRGARLMSGGILDCINSYKG